MATLSIAVFADATNVSKGVPSQTLRVTYTGTAGVSTAITGTTGAIVYCRLCADSACDYKIGSSPTAVAGTDVYLPSGAVEYVGVLVGHAISAVTHA